MSYDLVCLSHLRWDFVYQRPQHLMSRFGRQRRVFFVEEPVHDAGSAHLEIREPLADSAVTVVTPHLPRWMAGRDSAVNDGALRRLIDDLLDREEVRRYVLWYYTPIALAFTDHLRPLASVYDCMDELSAFGGAPRRLPGLEVRLMKRVDLLFAGGRSLYESKARRHPCVHLFPSSVDVAHFARARGRIADPPDQAAIGHPRLGYFGVIDERIDLALLASLADQRPSWQLVFVGPVAKIERSSLPQRPNIHYLGQKPYAELPAYLFGWDVALMPFALNEATRFISPTKTLEYLASGKPVVATPIHDVIRPYGEMGLVRIADTHEVFVQAVERALNFGGPSLDAIDAYLTDISWDRTWSAMARLIDSVVQRAGAATETQLAAPEAYELSGE